LRGIDAFLFAEAMFGAGAEMFFVSHDISAGGRYCARLSARFGAGF
jgi:hypothetical protein